MRKLARAAWWWPIFALVRYALGEIIAHMAKAWLLTKDEGKPIQGELTIVFTDSEPLR